MAAQRQASQTALPPHSEESERAVLGAVLVDPGLASKVFSRLRPEHFFVPANQLIARGMRDLIDAGTAVDLRTLQAHLELQGTFAAAGGIGYLATLDLDLPDVGRVDEYCDIVVERATRRRLITLASDVAVAGYASDSVDDLLARVRDAVPQLQAAAARPRLKALAEILPPFMTLVEDVGTPALRGLPTGYSQLDAFTGGFRRGNLIVIAGRPGLGKSALALNIAQHVALGRAGQVRPVGVWSLEMTNEELLLRMVCSEANVPGEMLRAGCLSTGAWQRVVRAARELVAAPLYVDDSSGLSINQIEGRIRRAVDEHGIEMAVLDYLQLARGREGGRQAENRNIEIGQISNALKDLSKDLRIPIVALSQLSREATKRPGNRPTLADLRDSGSIESDADLVAFVHRDAAYDPEAPPAEAVVIIAKHRHGRTGDVPLDWNGETTTFRNPTPREASAFVGNGEEEPF